MTAAALVVGLGSAQAQTAEQKLSFDLSASVLHYKGDMGQEYTNFEAEGIAPGFGLGFNYYLNPSFDLGAHFNFGLLNYTADEGHFTTEVYNFSPMLKYKFNNGYLLDEDVKMAPYLIAGPGISVIKVDGRYPDDGREEFNYSTFNLAIGPGLNLPVSENASLFGQVVYNKPMADKLDGISRGEGNDAYLQSSIGIRLLLGRQIDTDKDGIVDSKDKCPGTSALAKVDDKGCAIDTDRDGVADYLDACLTKAGPKATKGCPDQDGDGVIDSEDACPEHPGTKLLYGCSDTDRDGIADHLDECPEKAGSRFNQGCPAQKKSSELDPDLLERIGFAEKEIIFEVDKDELRGSSKEALEDVVSILNENPDLNLTIEGHADSTGEKEYNKQLSQDRANAVKQYLLNAGISADRLEAVSYGETQPVAENDGKTGRAENRRVVLILSPKK